MVDDNARTHAGGLGAKAQEVVGQAARALDTLAATPRWSISAKPSMAGLGSLGCGFAFPDMVACAPAAMLRLAAKSKVLWEVRDKVMVALSSNVEAICRSRLQPWWESSMTKAVLDNYALVMALPFMLRF